MTLDEIKQAIKKLSPNELTHLRQWFEEYDNQLWDEQFEIDAKSGKLDKIANKAITRGYLNKLRGSLKGKGLLKALMAEKEFEKKY